MLCRLRPSGFWLFNRSCLFFRWLNLIGDFALVKSAFVSINLDLYFQNDPFCVSHIVSRCPCVYTGTLTTTSHRGRRLLYPHGTDYKSGPPELPQIDPLTQVNQLHESKNRLKGGTEALMIFSNKFIMCLISESCDHFLQGSEKKICSVLISLIFRKY